MTTVDVSKLEAAIEAYEREAPVLLAQALTLVAHRIAAEAKRTTLFRDRTGSLRRSIMPGRVESSGDMLTVDVMAGGTGGVDYALFVHEGTRHMRARPFMREAVERLEPWIADTVSAAIDTAARRAGL